MRNATVCLAKMAESPLVSHSNETDNRTLESFCLCMASVVSLPHCGDWWLLLWSHNNGLKFVQFHEVFLYHLALYYICICAITSQVLIFSFVRFFDVDRCCRWIRFFFSKWNRIHFSKRTRNAVYTYNLQRLNNEKRERIGNI